MLEYFIEILKIVLPASLVLLGMFLVVKKMLQQDIALKRLEQRADAKGTILPLRLQAYERMTLFLERISPNSLIMRVRQSGMSAKDLHIALLAAINSEYDHNISQQIYVSTTAWDGIQLYKNDLVKNINLIANSMSKEASSLDFSKAILGYYMKEGNAIPVQKPLEIIKLDVKNLYL